MLIKKQTCNVPNKKVFIIGDSLINGVNPNRFTTCKNISVSVKPFGGSTSRHMLDYIKPIIRKKPDMVIFHVGTNDLTNSIDTKENINKLLKYVTDSFSRVKLSI